MEKNRLLVVDAYALLYRANFAFVNRPLITKSGANTSAIFGFMRTFMECMRTYHPTHVAVAFDLKGPTFRHEMFPAYKAQRPPAPDGVIFGAEKLQELLPILGLRMVSSPGYEADDVAGTLVERFAGPETQVLMFTPDKDYQQLLGEHSLMVKPSRKGRGMEEVQLSDLLERYGIERAEQFIDILTLWGDASDNIPGVPGIGEKNAARLIAKYGSIERLLGNVGKLSPKMRENISLSSKQLALTRELVRIARDVPISDSLQDYTFQPADGDRLMELCQELEFKTLGMELYSYFVKGLGQDAGQHQAEDFGQTYDDLNQHAIDYTVVRDAAGFDSMLSAMEQADLYALDTETTGFSYHLDRVVGMSISLRPWQGWFLPIPPEGLPKEWTERLARELAREGKRIIGHNLKFDLGMLRGAGFDLRGEILDTMIMHYLLAPDLGHSLDEVAQRELNYQPIPYASLAPERKTGDIDLNQVDGDLLARYAIEDADVALRLYHALWPKLTTMGMDQLYSQIEGPIVRILSQMEWHGVRIDSERFATLGQELRDEMERMRGDVRRIAQNPELNVDSPRQLGILLFEQLQLADRPRRTKTGQYNTSEAELLRYAGRHEVVATILEYREVKKLLSTYAEALPKLVCQATGRIHARFNQAVTTTGRLSSSQPNLQNIPVRRDYGRRIRRGFISRFDGGNLLSADYSQIELRLMAAMSKDPTMIEAFRSGQDVHQATAARIFNVEPHRVSREQRGHAKGVNFGVIYGISAYGLSQQLGVSVADAASFIKEYFALYPGVEQYMAQAIAQCREKGYAETLWGRRRPLPDIYSGSSTLRGAAERNAINTPIQGTAADIIKRAMINIDSALRAHNLQSLLTTQVHDELIFDVFPGEQDLLQELVRTAMEDACALPVPLVVDISTGPDWGEL